MAPATASPSLNSAAGSTTTTETSSAWSSGQAVRSIEEIETERRKELWAKKSRSIREEKELQNLLYKYREELKRRHILDESESFDLQWILAHPPENRLGELQKEEEWDQLMLVNGVYQRTEDGQRIPGPNAIRLEEYEASKYEIQQGRMRIGSRGDVIPYDSARGRTLPLPAVNLPLTPEGIEGRRVFLYSISEKARASRLKVIEHLAASGAMLTECEKTDLEYLKNTLGAKRV